MHKYILEKLSYEHLLCNLNNLEDNLKDNKSSNIGGRINDTLI